MAGEEGEGERDSEGHLWRAASLSFPEFTLVYHHTVPSSPLPPLVFLHAFTSTGPRQLGLFSALADSFWILLPTARGHGKSTPIPKGSFTMDKLVADVAAFIQKVLPGDKVFLVGHSMGASTAARVAKQFPFLIRGIVLEDPPWRRNSGEPFHPPEDDGPLGFLRFAEKVRSMSDEDFEKIKSESPFKLFPSEGRPGVDHGRLESGSHRPEAEKKRENDMPSHGPGNAPFAQSMLEGLRQLDVEVIKETFMDRAERYISEAVEGISVPTLLLTGEPGKAHCSPDVAAATLATWPKGKERNFPGAGHGIHGGPHQKEFVGVLRSFFNELISD